jgi:hypothetical protein
VVDEVLRSGRDTHTVFCVSQSGYWHRARADRGFRTDDLAAELLELARLVRETVFERQRRRKHRDYLP